MSEVETGHSGGASLVAHGKEPANVGDRGVAGLIPGWGRSPGEGNGSHCSIPACKIPRTEEPGRLQSMESQKSLTLGDSTTGIQAFSSK